ncbi:MAG TPA: TetR/AcrR family transcriptional regulator [Nakamurella sp.]
MVRLTRVQQQLRTRAAVLAAAHREFAEHGYAHAKVDRIAARADLTRGSVYSNFPGKRALYLAVLVDLIERAPDSGARRDGPTSPAGAAGAFARTWLCRLPLAGDPAPDGRLRLRSLTGLLDDDHLRPALAQVAELEALLLGLVLEANESAPHRVRAARLILTTLHGAAALAETAPGFGDPFDVIRACEHLADLDLDDSWDPPHAAHVRPARVTDEPWTPPTDLGDVLTGHRPDLNRDGVITVLGAHRLGAAADAVRASGPGDRVTIVPVTDDPDETGCLVRARLADLVRCLRGSVGADPWPGLRLVLDDHQMLTGALGITTVGDDTEVAVRIRAGRIAVRATGRGAGLAAAVADPDGRREEGTR